MNNIYSNYIQYNNPKALQKRDVRRFSSRIAVMLIISSLALFITGKVLVKIMMKNNVIDTTGQTGIGGIPCTLYYLVNALCEFMAFFIVPFIFCLIYGFKLSDAIPIHNNKKHNTFFLIIGGYSICTVSNFFVSMLNDNLSMFGLTNTTGVQLSTQSIQDHIFYFLCVAIVPAVVEEFAFRGVILNYLRKFGDGFAIVASSILFGLIHGNFVQIPFAFIVGLVCGFLVVKTNSIVPSVILHLTNNGISVLLDIIRNYVSDDIGNIISNGIILLLTLAGFIAIVSLIKNNFTVKFEKRNDILLTAKDLFIPFIVNPGIIILLSIQIEDALETLLL